MQFVDKTINNVFKWENVDVSVPEMLELIQNEIMEESSSSDLLELEKGMHKTWALAVGGGTNKRYYPSYYREVRLCYRFNLITHQLQQISLQDTVNKKEYFIPSGKDSCAKLQRAVLRRMAQYSHDGRGVHQKSRNGGKFLNEKKKTAMPIAAVCGLVAVIAVVIGVIAILPSPGISTADAIATVQNGYLGEYTDLTVKEILDSCYGVWYEKNAWDGGTTDAGNMIVEVRYFNEQYKTDPTIIQFTMLNEQCFKITAFVDPSNPVEKATDLLAAMNFNYLVACADQNLADIGNNLTEYAFIARLNQISGSAVQYGAAVDYSGDRAKLCELDGETQLEVSVTMLLDNYGLLDMSYYIGGSQSGQNEENGSHTNQVEGTETDNPGIDNIEYVPYTVDELVDELHLNALRAKQEFQNQYIELTGTLSSFDSDGSYFSLGVLYDNEYSWDTIECFFTDSAQIELFVAKNSGDIITIRCKVKEVGEVIGYYVDILDLIDAPGNSTDEGNLAASDSNEHYKDFMVGEYWNLEDNKFFWIRSDETSNGNIIYWLEYPLGDGDGQGDVDKLVVPSTEYIPGNHGYSIYFHISDDVLDYYGDFEVSGYYVDYGIDYQVSSSVYGLFDTGGDRVTVIGPWNEWGQD